MSDRDDKRGAFKSFTEVGSVNRGEKNRLCVGIAVTEYGGKESSTVFITKQWLTDDDEWRSKKGGFMVLPGEPEALAELILQSGAKLGKPDNPF